MENSDQDLEDGVRTGVPETCAFVLAAVSVCCWQWYWWWQWWWAQSSKTGDCQLVSGWQLQSIDIAGCIRLPLAVKNFQLKASSWPTTHLAMACEPVRGLENIPLCSFYYLCILEPYHVHGYICRAFALSMSTPTGILPTLLYGWCYHYHLPMSLTKTSHPH